jgi:HAAS
MNGNSMIDQYLQEFARTLRLRSRLSRRVLDEVNDHLREAVKNLVDSGVDPETAARMAIERFGSPAQVVERFETEAPLESEVEMMLRYVLMPVAAMSFLFGGLFFGGAWCDDASSVMHLSKLIAASIVVSCSVILFYQGWVTRPLRPWERALALIAALVSIMIGSMGGVFTAHLGLVTHDWEMYGFAGAGALVLQGVLGVVSQVLSKSTPRPEAYC